MPDQRRPWIASIAGGVAFALGAGLLAFALTERGVDLAWLGDLATGRRERPIAQAPWRVQTFAIGVSGGKSARRRVARVRPDVRRMVQQVYNATFLAPPERRRLVARRFEPGAARSWLRSGAGVPGGASLIKTLVRKARIGIGGTAAQATAEVRVVARAVVDGRRIKVAHEGTLWIARRGNRWKVIGFQIDQKRVA